MGGRKVRAHLEQVEALVLSIGELLLHSSERHGLFDDFAVAGNVVVGDWWIWMYAKERM